jgi:hypothetical protein
MFAHPFMALAVEAVGPIERDVLICHFFESPQKNVDEQKRKFVLNIFP